ncbi:MAG TPA: LysM peptidoglycan-binding domain-containing protein [Lutibacter sp.]|nr:LysM peptidoglycan-binding domain-containing protein [Lutibacter sp.]
MAYKYKLAVPDLRRWNGIRKNEIRLGQRIFITNPSTIDSLNNNEGSHIVIQEDTLYSISKRYQISVPELMRLNNLKNYTIYIGQVLVVK